VTYLSKGLVKRWMSRFVLVSNLGWNTGYPVPCIYYIFSASTDKGLESTLKHVTTTLLVHLCPHILYSYIPISVDAM
jgi:hypothetical protein